MATRVAIDPRTGDRVQVQDHDFGQDGVAVRRIINVADGADPTDVATVAQTQAPANVLAALKANTLPVDFNGQPVTNTSLDVVLMPLGGGQDDALQILAACIANAYGRTVRLGPGVFIWATPASASPSTWLPSGTRLVGSGRNATIIKSTLTPTPTHSTQYNSPLYANGNEGGDGVAGSTLSGAHAAGVKVFTLVSVTNFAVGQRINVQAQTAPYSHLEQFEIVAVNTGTNQVTLDRPTQKPYSNTDPVQTSGGFADFLLAHFTISGTGDRAAELICARNGLIYDVHVDGRYGSFKYAGIGCDYGVQNVTIEKCSVDGKDTSGGGGQATGAGILVESGFNVHVFESKTRRCTQGIYVSMCDHSEIVGVESQENSGPGVQISNGANTDLGCKSVRLVACKSTNNQDGVIVQDDSRDIELHGCSLEFNTRDGLRAGDFQSVGTAPARIKMLGGSVKKNGANGVNFAGGKGHMVVGTSFEDNAPSTQQGHVLSTGAGTMVKVKAVFVDNGVFTSNVSSFMLAASGGRIDATDCEMRVANDTGQQVAAVETVGSGSEVNLTGCHFDPGVNAIFLYMNGAGKARLARCSQSGGSNGVYVDASVSASTCVIEGARTDFAAVATPLAVANGGVIMVVDWPNAGTPEGAIVGSPGSTANDTTNGELYVKKTGTGNTGWKLVTHA